MQKSNKKYNTGMLIFNILSLIIVVLAIHLLIKCHSENHKNQELQESLIADAKITTDVTTINEAKVENIHVDLNSLLAKNPDTVRLD